MPLLVSITIHCIVKYMYLKASVMSIDNINLQLTGHEVICTFIDQM